MNGKSSFEDLDPAAATMYGASTTNVIYDDLPASFMLPIQLSKL